MLRFGVHLCYVSNKQPTHPKWNEQHVCTHLSSASEVRDQHIAESNAGGLVWYCQPL